MIGMTFAEFLTLLIISLITAAIVQFAFRYSFLGGVSGFLAKWIVAWLGAWVGTPVLGYWFAGVYIGSIYIVPAFIGGFTGSFMITAFWRAVARARSYGIPTVEVTTTPGTRAA